MSQSDLHNVTLRELEPYLLLTLAAGRVPFIHGSPGIGKSAIVKSVAKKLNLKMIDHRLSTAPPEDLSGLPRVSGEYAEYLPFEEFPVVGTPLPTGPDGKPYDGWILFLDEYNTAPKETQAASYKLLLDRMVGQKQLHPAVKLVTAGNQATDGAIVNRLGTAARSRVTHYVVIFNEREFIEDVVVPQNFNYRVIGYLNAYPSDGHVFDPKSEENTFRCPRTWEMASDLWNAYDESADIIKTYHPKIDAETWMAVPLAGTLGSVGGEAFAQFCRVYQDMPTLNEIVIAPNSTKLPANNDQSWAVTTMLFSNTDPKSLPAIHKYMTRVGKASGVEFEIVYYRHVLATHPEWRRDPAVIDMLTRLSELETA